MEEVNLYKKEQNIEQISVFNKKINDVIVKQPSNFIYERIGERYNHFLIDEFQDTSVLQWQNLMPLITDVVDYGSCFIVGDGKQSIYRWRGGEVEQFVKIPEIFKGDNLPEKTVWEQKLSYHYKEDKGENQNYRSRKNIIDFNNKFFSSLKNKLTTDLQQIYTDAAQNTDVAKDGGYVHLELVKEEGD
jgi:ATP-dependent exoDNAse (exonuclease V) beta subunit